MAKKKNKGLGKKDTKKSIKKVNQGSKVAQKVLDKGTALGQQILPELFSGSGLDRHTFNPIKAQMVTDAGANKYLNPAVADAQKFQGDTAGRYDEILDMRRARLGGLDTAENQALKESLFRNVDRQRAGAMSQVSRNPNLGAGASFAQKRAIGRDYGEQALQAERELLLENINQKRQALADFEGSTTARQGAVASAGDRTNALRGQQAQNAQGVATLNAGNQMTADQFNASGALQTTQFNADQQGKEIAGRVGAVSTGAGLVLDERDKLKAEEEKRKTMDFLAMRDQQVFNQAQSLFG
jgi:hypothetical protein